ncbi:MAG: type II toxin-antitoxin system VapC family toxin [Ilumatobacteraceae bacterium]
MSQAPGLLDTSVVVALSQTRITSQLPELPMISAITLAELSVGPLIATDATERAKRQAVLQEAEAAFDPLPVNAAVARVYGRVGAELRARGNKSKARSYDALIAAVAIANGLTLYTANPEDFAGISELEVVSVSW